MIFSQKAIRKIQVTIKWITISFFIVAFLSLTIAQVVPVEFADWKMMHSFYDTIFAGLPLAVLLTLVWTLKKSKPKARNIRIALLTGLGAVFVLFSSYFLMFTYGFSAWTNQEIIFVHLENSKHTINHQILDIGAFGYGGQRVVEIKPFLEYWSVVKSIDTTTIQTSEWERLPKQIDKRFP